MREYSNNIEGDNPEAFDEKRIAARLMNDFLGSFYLSQGTDDQHSYILEVLAATYAEELNDDQKTWMLEDLFLELDERVERLTRLPSNHSAESDIHEIFDEQWLELKISFAEAFAAEPPTEEEMNERYVGILEGIILDDLRFMESGRRNRTEGNDPYESLFRKHVVLLEPTLSKNITNICLELHSRWREGSADEYPRLIELVAAWEQRHPGENFFQTEY